MTVTTTLNKIKQHDPCSDGWKKLLKHLGKTQADDEEFPMSIIIESNGLYDCLWALRSRPDLSNLWKLFAVKCARQVEHLMTDDRSINALNVAERHAQGKATDDELSAAYAAARAAAANTYVAYANAYVAYANAYAASASASDAAYAYANAYAASRESQEEMLKELLDKGMETLV